MNEGEIKVKTFIEKERKKGFPFLPGPAGTSPYHPRRIEDGGKFMRLKRR